MGIRQKPGTGVQRLRAPDRSTGCGDYRENTAPGGGGWRWRPQTEIRDRAPDRQTQRCRGTETRTRWQSRVKRREKTAGWMEAGVLTRGCTEYLSRQGPQTAQIE